MSAIDTRNTAAFLLAAFALMLAGCANDPPEYKKTHSLSLAVSVYDAQAQVSKETSPMDPAEWLVQCISLDTEGVKTTNTSTLVPETGRFEVGGIPDGEDTICHLVDGKGSLVATVSVSDPGALVGVRDVFRLLRDAHAAVVYDPLHEVAQAFGTDFDVGEAEERADLEGRWRVGCNEVRSMVTDEAVEGLECAEEVQAPEIYMHSVTASGPGGERRVSYGIWSSEEAFARCGTTEGLDALPFGWSLDTTYLAQSSPFAFSAPFDLLTPGSSSTEILDMIVSNAAEGMSGYEDFKAENAASCQDEAKCAVWYYHEMRRYGLENAGEICWPQLVFIFMGDGGVAAGMWPSSGGRASPLGRLHFIEAFKYGNETYMRSAISQVREVYAESEAVECKLKEEFLMAVEIPDSDEDGSENVDEDSAEIKAKRYLSDDLISEGTSLEARYRSITDVSSIGGEYDNLCRQALGEEDVGSGPGLYSDVVLESTLAP